MGEGGIVISLHKHIALGTALGLGVSLPIRQTSAASQNLLRFIYSPSIDARVRLSRHFRLVLQLRGIFGERAITEKEEDTTAGMMSALEQSDASAQSLLGLLGVQASF
jgi:hypothetical protein